VYADHEQDNFDRMQRSKIGKISLAMGLCMLLMILIPNPLWGRLLFLLSAAAIILFGYVLWRSATSTTSTQGSNYVYRPEK
ncbi:MAG: hypothetical protein E6017_21620, partial [Kluyvera cryocrescens]|nr:hypothetical protein [Kluyvera cryocrescens]